MSPGFGPHLFPTLHPDRSLLECNYGVQITAQTTATPPDRSSMECVTKGCLQISTAQTTSMLPTIRFSFIRTLALDAIGARTLVLNTFGGASC
jgi:hypothetical protein